jgi:hypothetical protein
MDLEKLLIDSNPASWEVAFRDYVQTGKVSVDDWLWEWLWCRMKWPDERFSLFHKGNVVMQTQLFGVNILIESGDIDKRRYVEVKMYEANAYHPDFMELEQVTEMEWRFPSVGNPYLDEPNYIQWEKMLFCKLGNIIFEEKKGLDFLIERSRR